MSEYCYLCEGCNRFSNDCICKDGFQDPMEYWKGLDPRELMREDEEK